MNNRNWKSSYNWWVKHQTFSDLWHEIVCVYADKIAYFDHEHGITYQKLAKDSQYYQQKFLGQKIIRINGLAKDWLTQAIAAWTSNQLVIFYNPSWKEQDPIRYQLVMSSPNNIDWSNQPHLLLFTSGSTGNPKPIIRGTALALYEAACYIEDVLPKPFDQAICLIKPWFGAITKHCLGMLLAGIPQHFELSATTHAKQNSLIYGTPSLITNHAAMAIQPWQALSLTGERVNANHLEAFKQCLHTEGFIIDAFGASECGVIARRKLPYSKINELLSAGFRGEILPGKQIHINDQGLLSVQALNLPAVLTGDLAKVEGNTLHLIGRLSSKRKMRGVWVDVSPLINLLSTHPNIIHFQLSEKQTASDQLIVYVCAKNTLSKNELYQWLFHNLCPVKLLPQLILEYRQPTLGSTGKQKIHINHSSIKIEDNNYLNMMADLIINLPSQLEIIDKSLEELGFDSLDIISLIAHLEKKGSSLLPIQAILKTDTPRQIANLINQEYLLRRINSSGDVKNQQILCIGSGILTARMELSQQADLIYTDIIYHQKQFFSFKELASLIIKKEFKRLSQTNNLFIAGYSINCLLAIELAYQLEQQQVPIKGIFLLDPPNNKRVRYLKKKKLFLMARSQVLNYLIHQGQLKWEKRFYHELRKLAIIQQPMRDLKAPSLSIYSLGQLDKNRWLKPNSYHKDVELDFFGHLELVNSSEGIKSWNSWICNFVKCKSESLL